MAEGLVFSPEDELLLLLAPGSLTSDVREQASNLLKQRLSWPYIVKQARLHGVLPLLFRNLQSLSFPGVPADIQSQLKAAFLINAFRNTLLAEELVRVLSLLGEARVPVIPLKGVTLAESLYGDISLRVCSDIDILVPHSKVPQAFHLLLAMGYRTEFTGRFFEKLLLRTKIEYALTREEMGIPHLLELHWAMMWGRRFEGDATEDLWAEAEEKTIFGVPAYALSPEWELLFLSAHAARHHWQGLKWLVDIHELCVRGEIVWAKVTDKAERLGWKDMVRLTLSVCHALFDTPIPAIFSLRALPPWLKLFPAYSASSDNWKNVLVRAHLLRRPSEKLRYLFRVLFVPTLAEQQFLQLPSALGFLYYPLRLFRLGSKWSWLAATKGVPSQIGKS